MLEEKATKAKGTNARTQTRDQGHKRNCLKKKELQNFFLAISKKRSSKIFFRQSQKKNGQEKNFPADLQNFNHSKNSAVLEPRTKQFLKT